MDILILFKALILGIIEGLTEPLPISSTGHLIVFGGLMNLQSNGKVFEIVIQLGVVLVVVFEYRQRFTHTIKRLGKEQIANRSVLNLFIVFIPAVVVGPLFSKQVKLHLFNPIIIITMLILGGFFILWAEKRQTIAKLKINHVDNMRPIDAFVVGCAQICASIFGTLRSGNTTTGGMLWGSEYKTATEFSFFLAVPMMIVATGYDISKNYRLFTLQDAGQIAIGLIVAPIAGLLAVEVLLKSVLSKNYVPFAYCRIAFGGLILFTWMLGIASWSE